jgi:hypothetical protein
MTDPRFIRHPHFWYGVGCTLLVLTLSMVVGSLLAG